MNNEKETPNKGVLNSEYNIERQQKKELIFRYKTRAQIVVNYIKKYLKQTKNLKILDFGAADALTMLELDKILPGNNITGIEYSADLIKTAPELPENMELIQGDVTNLPADIKNKKYDVVIALALLEHLENPLCCLKGAHDSLRRGGLFIATSPNPFWDNISTKLGLLKGDQHETDMKKSTMIELTEAAGFKVLKFDRFMWAPFAVLPYLGLKLSPKLSLKIDNFAKKIFIFNFLFVNQIIVLRK